LRTIYRIRVTGRERISSGGALLVANHLSHVDALLIGAALAPREVRFLMHRALFAIPVVGAFARLMGAMPVASEDTPEQKAESLRRAAEAAAGGELVCIFAEGGISRSGALLPFARGLESIARDARVPIVPVALDRLWGSVFSFSGGRFFWKFPRRIPYPVEVAFGAPMPFGSERWRVRDAVAELVARSREGRIPRTRSLAFRFLRSARRHAGSVAVVDADGRSLSYRRLLREVLAAGASLRRRAPASRRIAIKMPAGIDAVIAHAAAALCGLTVVPSDGRDEEAAAAATDELRSLPGDLRWTDRLRAGLLCVCPGPLLARLLDPVRDGREPAALYFSGSAGGERRGALLSHGGLASSSEALAQMFGFGPGETVLGVLPFSSVLGAVASMWIPLLSGGCAVYTRGSDAGGFGKLCTARRPTVIVATPFLYRRWLEECAPEELASVKLFVCGGARLDRALAEAWEARFHAVLCEGYGCTELAGVVSVNLPGIESSDLRQNASKPGTVGRAIPGVAVRVVDPVTFELLPPEQEGLLLARGPGRMIGYEGEGPGEDGPHAGAREGWIVTGDRALLDKDAFLVIRNPSS